MIRTPNEKDGKLLGDEKSNKKEHPKLLKKYHYYKIPFELWGCGHQFAKKVTL